MSDLDDLLSNAVVAQRLANFESSLSDALAATRINPTLGLGRMIDAGLTIRPYLDPSGMIAITGGHHPLSAYSSLAQLGSSALTIASTSNPVGLNGSVAYGATLNSLTTASAVGAGFRDVFTTGLSAISGTSAMPTSLSSASYHLGVSDSYAVARSIASPYLASTAAVYEYESALSRYRIGSADTIDGFAAVTDATAAVGLTPLAASLSASVFDLSGALDRTWGVIGGDASLLANAPAKLLRSPAVEMYTAAQVSTALVFPAETIESDPELEDILSDQVNTFESRLAALDQNLVTVYQGGIRAIERGDADWQRQSMVSFRELCTHVLHMLAPDDRVLPVAEPADLHNGRPTRRARLRFIFAPAAGDAVASFFEADLRAAVALFEVLNEGTHRLGSSATPDQLHYLRGRIVGLIASMLEAQGY